MIVGKDPTIWIRFMKQVILTNKRRLKQGLYLKLLVRINEAWNNTSKNYLSFKDYSEKICRNFSISKAEGFELLQILEEFGYISFVQFKGIKLNYRIENVK